MTTFNKIAVSECPVVEDFICSGTPYPGMLCELYNNSGVVTARAHSGSAAASASSRIFLEDSLNGVLPSTAYTAAAQARVGTFRSGDKAVLLVANGEAITYMTKLEHAGSGKFRAMASAASSYLSEDSWIASVDEVGLTTASGDTLVRCRFK